LTRSSFVSGARLMQYVAAALDYQLQLGVTRLVSPTICVEDFNDTWSQVALQMAQASVEYHAGLAGAPPLLISLVFTESALGDRRSLEELLDVASTFEASGFYVVVNRLAPSYAPAFGGQRLEHLF